MTKEEWMEETTEANPLDRHLKRKRELRDAETPLSGLLLVQADGQYVLLNRSGRDVDTVVYDAVEADDLNRRASRATVYVLEDVPNDAWVSLGASDPRPQVKTVFSLTRVEWNEEAPWTGALELSPFSRTEGAQALAERSVRKIQHGPTRIGTYFRRE